MPYVERNGAGKIIAVGSHPENIGGPAEFVEETHADIIAFHHSREPPKPPKIVDADPEDNSVAKMRVKFNELTAALRDQGIIE